MNNNNTEEVNSYNKMKKLWEEFKEDIKHGNRFFSGTEIVNKLNKIKRRDEKMEVDDSRACTLHPCAGEIELYRARIGDFTDEKKYNDKELLNPPVELSKPGRCNPRGVSYLYLTSDICTAIHEVKPSKGDEVTVAKIEVSPKEVLNFEILSKYGNFKNYDVKNLVKIIDKDFSSAITSNEEIEYLPFQFLAEYVKKRGFDCFAFSSSIAEGVNYIIFNSESASVKERKLYRIKDRKCTYEEIEK